MSVSVTVDKWNSEIIGYVDGQEVVKINNHVGKEWSTAVSSCLPSNIKVAAEYAECYHQVFEKLKGIQK